MNIQLSTGTTITMSYYEYLFNLNDEDMDEFYQSCVADNLGTYIENPFSHKSITKLHVEEVEDEEDPE